MKRVFLIILFIFFVSSCSDSQPQSSKTKILLVGIDGADWKILNKLMENNKAPTIKSLIEKGVKSSLKTLEPTLSPAIWTTIATGYIPDKHGILGFDGVPGQTMRTLPTSQMGKIKAMWNIASNANKKVGMINWWVTWPAEKVNGFIVSDRITYSRMEASIHKEFTTEYDVYPKKLMDEIKYLIEKPNDITKNEIKQFMTLSDEEIERFKLGINYKMGDFLLEFKYAYQSDKSTMKIGEYLLKKEKPDLCGILFTGVDTVSHLYWHFMEPQKFKRYKIQEDDILRYGKVIEKYYIYIDTLLNRLLKAADGKYTVIIVSDHGFGSTGHFPWSGGHGKITLGAPIAPDGILVMSGNNIKKGNALDSAHVLDILPTILYLLNLPVAKDMQGRVLVDAFNKDFTTNNPIKYINTFEEKLSEKKEPLISLPERDKDILEKLKSLGYIQ